MREVKKRSDKVWVPRINHFNALKTGLTIAAVVTLTIIVIAASTQHKPMYVFNHGET
jgi:hypothetical protein